MKFGNYVRMSSTENESRKRWLNVKEHPPIIGEPVLIRIEDEVNVAYFCDSNFYCLEYDPHLGILRKQCVTDTVQYWANLIVPD